MSAAAALADRDAPAPLQVRALTKYGTRAASTRQRFSQFAPILREAGLDLALSELLGERYLAPRLGRGAAAPAEAARGYLRRLHELALGPTPDLYWVQYELFPYLPGALDRLLRLRRRPIVLDLDDAIHHGYDHHRSPLVRRLLGRKLDPMLAAADLVICGNDYLRDWAARAGRPTAVVPTVLDADQWRPAPRAAPRRAPDGPVIGWIGSPSTWGYVRPLAPLLRALAAEGTARTRVVGAGEGAPDTAGFEALPWSEATEIGLVQGMDIGVMPLPDTPWTRGKCGYKLVQYMACGLPVVASPVGVNRDLVEPGVNGFLASTDAEWHHAIRTLAADPALRARMGEAGRRKVVEGYSLQAQGPRLAALLGGLARQGRELERGRGAGA